MAAGNTGFMKELYFPTLQEGKDANSMLVSVTTARNALKNIGNTGWGTPTKLQAASMLSAMGVPQATKFAANAEMFQQAAMERLWSTLNAAKGMQTEGDASRAGQTFVQLKDTTQKNLYVLDLAQAVAEKAQRKAQFFREAYPLAVKEGDLQRVDREWNDRKLNISIFDMPSMKKWAQ